MYDRNSRENLIKWVERVMEISDIDEADKIRLVNMAMKEIDKGLWRGDISRRWVKAGYKNKLKDLYL